MSKTRPFCFAAACFGAATLLAWGDPQPLLVWRGGYLPVVGPAPLRFRLTPERVNLFIQLPPPGPAQADSVPTSPDSAQTEWPDPHALSDLLAPVADKGAVIMESSSPPPAPTPEPMTAPEEPITPQIFMRYFSGHTNAPQYNPSAPVEFTPPRVVAPTVPDTTIQGKATYSIQ
ncbi:MAG TPA: hypothetical protein VHB20_02060 [Verrucomicrobiae bacterium]|nr:hypothetical protein [Verrucomicrobiae bacterium]